MAIDFDLDSVQGVAIGIARGLLNLGEIEEAASAMWRRIEGPDIRMLWDLRAARFDLSADEVRELADFVTLHSPPVVQTAFVVARDLEFGLVRMFEVFRETPGARTSVFRARQEALEWLVEDST